jgi:hypothetical protein
MASRVFRTAIFAGVMLALWLVGRPAHAASFAPFCDDRGATALAPPPALEATDEAVRRAATRPCDADTEAPVFGLALQSAHRIVRTFSADATPAAPPAPPRVLPTPLLDGPIAFVARETPPQAGVRYRVERPPRG